MIVSCPVFNEYFFKISDFLSRDQKVIYRPACNFISQRVTDSKIMRDVKHGKSSHIPKFCTPVTFHCEFSNQEAGFHSGL